VVVAAAAANLDSSPGSIQRKEGERTRLVLVQPLSFNLLFGDRFLTAIRMPMRKTSTTAKTMPTMPPVGKAGLEVVRLAFPPLLETEADGLGTEVEVVVGWVTVESEVLEGVSVLEGRVLEDVEFKDGTDEVLTMIGVEGIWISVIVNVNGGGVLSSSAFPLLCGERRFPWRTRAAGERRW
jgi:hypothetical protein